MSAVYLLRWVVTCARCGADHLEDSDDVTYRDGDWWCRYEQDCDDRVTEARYGAFGRSHQPW